MTGMERKKEYSAATYREVPMGARSEDSCTGTGGSRDQRKNLETSDKKGCFYTDRFQRGH